MGFGMTMRMLAAFAGIFLLFAPLLLTEGRRDMSGKRKSPAVDLDSMLDQMPTNTSLDTAPKTRSGQDCADKHQYCDFWAAAGECTKNPNYMLNYCKKSCRVGDCYPDCIDKHSYCSYWAGIGECDKNPSYMKVRCRKSCGECCKDQNQSCDFWAAAGECEKNPNYMLKYCQASCYVDDCKPPCTDKHRYCSFWAGIGECKRNPNYMLVRCPKSCNQCAGENICKCGQSNEWSGRQRIVNGVDAKKNEYPWMVLTRLNGQLWCGGSIISSREILTAAHCTFGKTATDFTVMVGEYDTSKSDGERTFSVCSKIENPNYDSATPSEFDLAILTLCDEIPFAKDASPVCLPEVNGQDTSLNDGVDTIITGWGLLKFPGGSNPDKLQEVQMKTLSNAQCRQLGYDATDSKLCASATDKSICFGDSGGPWFTKREKSYIQIGVSSWTTGGCAESAPVGAARVSNQLTWIKNNMAGVTCPKRP